MTGSGASVNLGTIRLTNSGAAFTANTVEKVSTQTSTPDGGLVINIIPIEGWIVEDIRLKIFE